MPYLQSVAIEAVAYDERAHLLKARFRADGKVMIYENVPPEVYDSLIFADSISGFLREHIDGNYPAREASPDVDSGVCWSSSLAASRSRSRATCNRRTW